MQGKTNGARDFWPFLVLVSLALAALLVVAFSVPSLLNGISEMRREREALHGARQVEVRNQAKILLEQERSLLLLEKLNAQLRTMTGD